MSFNITRNDSIQIETQIENKRISKWRIKWEGKCIYNITLIEDNYGYYLKAKKKISYSYEIIEVAKDHYFFKEVDGTFGGGGSGTLWKIE